MLAHVTGIEPLGSDGERVRCWNMDPEEDAMTNPTPPSPPSADAVTQTSAVRTLRSDETISCAVTLLNGDMSCAGTFTGTSAQLANEIAAKRVRLPTMTDQAWSTGQVVASMVVAGVVVYLLVRLVSRE